jgi:aminocarboxymuconate-semialdehyde decarboxylase
MWLHTCRQPACCAAESSSGGGGVGRRPLTIDLHCHALVPEVEALVADRPQKRAEPDILLKTMGAASVAHNNAVMLPKAGPKLTRIAERLADMDAMGVDVQVLSPSPTQYYYWADPELAQEVGRLQNERIAELCAQHPRRLAGLGTLALQHPALACEQLEHAVKKLGLKGIEISTSVNGKELSDPSLRPVWDKAETLGALVFIHPFGSTLGDRTATHYLVNTIGQPLETTIALSHLIFGGVLDAYPGLKIVAAHGGGYLPTYVGRSDHAWQVRPEAATTTRSRPSEYLKRIWFDTVVYDGVALRHLVERVGASQVVVGTDYPFDMGCYDVHGLVASAGLSEADRAAVLGGNAARLIGWPTQVES